MKKGAFFGFILFFIVFNLVFVSGEILLSQPDMMYNLGDDLRFNASIIQDHECYGFFELELDCGGDVKNFYRNLLSFKTAGKKRVSAALPEDFFGLKGDCNVVSTFINETTNSQEFVITDEIDLEVIISKSSIETKEKLTVEGEAVKKNGENAEGFINLKIDGANVDLVKEVNKGEFEFSLSLPEDLKSGDYDLEFKVYEKDGDEITNYGKTNSSLFVEQTPTEIEIKTNKDSIIPGNKLNFKPVIYDQAGEIVEEKIALSVYDSNNIKILQKISESENETIEMATNESKGIWRIEAEALDLNSVKEIIIEEYEKASFEVVNNSLIITNIGNVRYTEPVEVSIGNHTVLKNVDLSLGEEMILKLSAPTGTYSVKVTEKNETSISKDVALTGGSIGVKEFKEDVSLFLRYPVIWIFLILVFGTFILLMTRKVYKERSYAYPVEDKAPKLSKRKEKKEDAKPAVNLGSSPKKIERSLVMDGNKEDVSLLALKINNLDKVKDSKIIKEISKITEDNEGSIYKTSNYLFSIFSPQTTKTFKNEMTAIKTGRKIKKILDNHNSISKQKIDYGLSANFGKLILKKDKDTVRFTNIGDTMNLARRIAGLADKEFLLSKKICNKLRSRVRTRKETRKGINVYHIKRISQRDKHKKFIKNFLERQEQENKSEE